MAISSFLEGLKEYISGLDMEKQERIAGSLLRRAVNEEYSLDESYSLFAKRGFSIERERFSDLYTNIQQKELNSQRVKFISRNVTPSEDILYPSFTLKDARYNFGVSYEVYDETDEETYTKYFFLETNDLMTRGQIENMATTLLSNLYGDVADNFSNVQLRYGEINVKAIR